MSVIVTGLQIFIVILDRRILWSIKAFPSYLADDFLISPYGSVGSS